MKSRFLLGMRGAFIIALIVFLLDQLSKFWIRWDLLSSCEIVVRAYQDTRSLLHCSEYVTLLPILNFRLHLNPGVSFSWFSSSGEVGRWMLTALAFAMVAGMIYYMAKEKRAFVTLGGALVIGGAFGNVFDRVTVGAVVDFIDFHFGGWHPFIFNIADAAISLGVVCLLLDTFIRQPDPQSNELDPQPKP